MTVAEHQLPPSAWRNGVEPLLEHDRWEGDALTVWAEAATIANQAAVAEIHLAKQAQTDGQES